ncbi:Protein-tyrosine sulfotransferase, partial [Thalictrum thalictroides]
MASIRRVTLSILLLLLVFGPVSVISNEDEFLKCQRTVRKWSDSSLNGKVKEDKHTLQNLLFFLHVPRTGGRTYFHCFLRKLYASYLECPRSYDKLNFDPSKTDCRLLVTHDDYSMMSRLPKERTSVVTILRKPVDRVLSTYEFAVEVAARFLVHPNLTSATQMTGRPKSNGVSTLDIWPWKYLVPWMRKDLFSRRDNRRHEVFKDFKESNGPYDVEKIVMPLHEFINDPVAHDIIHNGATFQVAGLTNNSFLPEAHEVRHCVREYQSLGKYVLEVAKKRLDDMLYVGLTEDHKGSATMFANVVGGQILSQLQALSPTVKKVSFNETVLSSSITDSMHDTDHSENSTNGKEAHKISSTGNTKTRNETMTVGQLMEAYEVCISSLRKSQARRRTASLKRVSPANFSKEARLQIPVMVFQQIISLNSLDVELYKHAQTIYAQQGKRLESKQVEVERQQNIHLRRGKHLVSNRIEM